MHVPELIMGIAHQIDNDFDVVRSAELEEGLVKLGADALSECRSQLMMRFRFLDAALWRMPLDPWVDGLPLATDGERLLYAARPAVTRYRNAPNELARDYLHTVLHCVFRHPFGAKSQEEEWAWFLACDIAAEAAALDMCGGAFACEKDGQRLAALEDLRCRFGALIPKKLYRAFLRHLGYGEMKELATLFERDSHRVWPCKRDDDRPAQSTSGEDEPDSGEGENPSEGDGSAGQGDERDRDDERDADADEAERDWEELAKQVEMGLASLLQQRGNQAGSGFLTVLSAANRRKRDYADFLRRFSVLAEDMTVNDDEFDYIFYTYGLSRYGNMPLVEPLEYRETNRVREFVIAIDTSGSCSGEMVRAFVARTYDILKGSESFDSQVNVHIVQCDAQVQSDVKVESLRQLDEYMARFELKGMGGTDFRPVFEHVAKLIDQGELQNLKGLVYFTDGYGTFPSERPPYDAAFVFVDDGMTNPFVPPWAMKVIMEEDELLAL